MSMTTAQVAQVVCGSKGVLQKAGNRKGVNQDFGCTRQRVLACLTPPVQAAAGRRCWAAVAAARETAHLPPTVPHVPHLSFEV